MLRMLRGQVREIKRTVGYLLPTLSLVLSDNRVEIPSTIQEASQVPLSEERHESMTEVLEWQKATDSPAMIRRTVEALAEGHLVVFPTETVYGGAASALVPGAVERACRAQAPRG